MKKTFKLEINSPCDANLDAMQKTTSGFFCDSCAKNVIDLSNKSNYEISKFITETKDKSNICARLKTSQLEEDFSILESSNPVSNLKYAVAVAASVLLTSNIAAQEKTTPATEQVQTKQPHRLVGKVAYKEPVNKNITFVLKGKLLDENTKKPIEDKRFSNIIIYVSGAQKAVTVTKTGEFSIPITMDKNQTEISVNFSSDDYYLQESYKINLSDIKSNTLNLDFSVDPKKFRMAKIAGGMGVIFQSKKLKTNS